MKLSVIIPTKDRGEVFDETLRCAVDATMHLDAELLIINDSKQSKPTVPNNNGRIRIFNNPLSGVASARNLGAKESSGELLLFLDDDIVISKSTVDHVLSLHDQIKGGCFNLNWEYPKSLDEHIDVTQFGRFMHAHQLTSFKGWYADSSWKDNSLFESKSVASFHLSISRRHFEASGGYNEQFPHAGFEDYDFPQRLKTAGLSFYIDSRVKVFHNEADRMKLGNWLASQERRAITRRMAVSLGYHEVALEYGSIKRVLLSIIVATHSLTMVFLGMIPNRKLFDPLYFKLVGALQAGKIYKGYTAHVAR